MVFELLIDVLVGVMHVLLYPFYLIPDMTSFYSGESLHPYRDVIALVPWGMLVPVWAAYMYAYVANVGAGIVRAIKSWIPSMGK